MYGMYEIVESDNSKRVLRVKSLICLHENCYKFNKGVWFNRQNT